MGVNLCRTLETPNMEGLHCDVTGELLQQLQRDGVAAWNWSFSMEAEATKIRSRMVYHNWWLIPLSTWVITPVFLVD